MKFFSSLSALVASAALVSASPIATRGEKLRLYRLKIVAPNAADLNNQYLSIDSDGSVGLFGPRIKSRPGGPVLPIAPPVVPVRDSARFYVTAAGPAPADANHYELHTYPIGIVDHALALNRTGISTGLMYLKDIASPNATRTNGPEGSRVDWKSFTLGGFSETDAGSDNSDGDDDDSVPGARRAVKRLPPPLLADGFSYGGSGGKWVLIQRAAHAFVTAWYDGTSIILDNYRPVDIRYELLV